MEVNNILSADIIDIIFDGRNKSYGAYDLRKTYNRRMITALLVTTGILLLLFVGYTLAGKMSDSGGQVVMTKDVVLQKIIPDVKKMETPTPTARPEVPKVKIMRVTIPKIVPDKSVKEDDMPPEVKTLEVSSIGSINQNGTPYDGITAPPVNTAGKGIAEAPKQTETSYDTFFDKVEIESAYPGGPGAWSRYLNKNLPAYYSGDVVERGIQGRVVVQFIVDKEGNVSDVQGVEGPKELWPIAEKVIKASGRWVPAIQNGRQVKSYKKQPITFQLQTE